jgi:diazepam-binding inhibitor (GABA receptor modulating acyl-CoA-binding protein)
MDQHELQQNFTQAQKDVTSLAERPNNPDLLFLYAHFKQATEGNCTGERPGMMDFVNRAKYDAWVKLSGMEQTEAMNFYINKVEELMND